MTDTEDTMTEEEESGSDREENDGYYTPFPVAQAIMRYLTLDGVVTPGVHQYLLEPSVGKGAFAAAMVAALKPEEVVGVDIVHHEGVDAVCEFKQSDFMRYHPEEAVDFIGGNPPFTHAEEHIRHGVQLLDPEIGVMALLLRLAFLGGSDRNLKSTHLPRLRKKAEKSWNPTGIGIHDTYRPQYVYVLDKRPSFVQRLKPKFKDGKPVMSKRDPTKQLMVKTTQESGEYGVFVFVAKTMRDPDLVQEFRALPWWNDLGRKMPTDGK